MSEGNGGLSDLEIFVLVSLISDTDLKHDFRAKNDPCTQVTPTTPS